MYSEVTQNVISLLEQSLQDEKKLDDYANQIGYSKYHLSRLFKQESGLTISEYIRVRRLATAAMYLIHTNESIIHIALELQYQSQEAFSRSFKELYHIAPAKYRKLMRLIHGNEEEKMSVETTVKGWFLSGSQPNLYEMKVDTKVFHTGNKAGLLCSRGQVAEGQFGTMMQSFSAKQWIGKRIKLSCFVKTEQVSKSGIWCRIDNMTGDIVQFDNMDNRPITGSTEWNLYSIVLDVISESESIHIGVMLVGSGYVWVDGFKFEEVALSVPTTNILPFEELPLEPINLGFEEQ